jgi:hypothetical protein
MRRSPAAGAASGASCWPNQAIRPRLHLCGHLHVPQERTLKDGRQVVNVGTTADGSVVLIVSERGRLSATREQSV